MRKVELINLIASETGVKDKKTIRKILDTYIDAIKSEVLQGETFNVPGFGTFQLVQRSEKVTNSLFTEGKDIVIPARKALRFKVSNLFKQTLIEKSTVKEKE